MNWKTLSLIALPVLVVVQGVASHNSGEVLKAKAFTVMTNTVSTTTDTSQSLPLLLSARDEQDTNCHDLEVCSGR